MLTVMCCSLLLFNCDCTFCLFVCFKFSSLQNSLFSLFLPPPFRFDRMKRRSSSFFSPLPHLPCFPCFSGLAPILPVPSDCFSATFVLWPSGSMIDCTTYRIHRLLPNSKCAMRFYVWLYSSLQHLQHRKECAAFHEWLSIDSIPIVCVEDGRACNLNGCISRSVAMRCSSLPPSF